MAHTRTSLLVHLFFSTKDRRPYVDVELGPRLFAYMGGILREIGSTPVLINGPADHVHALTTLPATLSLSDLLRELKTNSSRWVHEQWPHRTDFAWQSGYHAFSVRSSSAHEAERYIANQQEHHRHVSYQEEFLAFLMCHDVPFDPRYVWD
jgi:REP-associated tyrosine transposase